MTIEEEARAHQEIARGHFEQMVTAAVHGESAMLAGLAHELDREGGCRDALLYAVVCFNNYMMWNAALAGVDHVRAWQEVLVELRQRTGG